MLFFKNVLLALISSLTLDTQEMYKICPKTGVSSDPLFFYAPDLCKKISITVFEIKGAPCTLCAHFGCRVQGF